jgi:uncharacterized protein (TIGR00299 family) protein
MVIDPRIAGVSGDMFVGALLDLGADPGRVAEAMRTPMHCLPGCERLDVSVEETTRGGLRATRVEVNTKESVGERPADELKRAAADCLQRLEMSAKAGQFASGAISTIVSHEARLHGRSEEEVHLHESASVDTLADVIGSAVALDDLGLLADTAVYCTPVALGGGPLHFSHGIVSSPAPATLEILRSAGLYVAGGPVEAELATPTGAALLAALSAESVTFYPPMKPANVGYGAGTRDFAEMPNVLRVVIGEPASYGLLTGEVYVIETNLDDTSGEVIAHAADRLLREGARDVSVVPMVAKKGRPGHTITVIADAANAERMSRLLIEETGTLGVRLYRCERRTLARDFLSVAIPSEAATELVNVKVARTSDGVVLQVKPEYDDVKKVADRTGRPLREIEALATKKAREMLGET